MCGSNVELCVFRVHSSRAVHLFYSPDTEIERTGEMDYKKELLIKSATKLYSPGVDLEAAKERVRKLVADSISYDTPEMVEAVREYTEIKELWDNLEKEHLVLRDEIADG